MGRRDGDGHMAVYIHGGQQGASVERWQLERAQRLPELECDGVEHVFQELRRDSQDSNSLELKTPPCRFLAVRSVTRAHAPDWAQIHMAQLRNAIHSEIN